MITVRTALAILVVLLFNGCAFFLPQHRPEATGMIDADDPGIQYVGRFDASDPKRVKFDWAGVAICATFQGTSCSVRLSDGADEYAVTVDNRAPKILSTGADSVYRIASGLPGPGPHTVMIRKRTEPLVGRGTFRGFILDPGCRLLPPKPRPDRRIEFIGNSITSGYGDECDSMASGFRSVEENSTMSYAAMTARAIDADYFLISYSGRGVVRNYGDPNRTSHEPMPELYDRTCFYDSTMKWDFSRWTPQAVVINLGTNDFSTEPHPDSAVFTDAYRRLIDRVRTTYPGVTIFCICGPMIGEPCFSYVRETVESEQRREGREKDVFFIGIDETTLLASDWGCDHHPNIYGMQKMMNVIVPEIRLRMNW